MSPNSPAILAGFFLRVQSANPQAAFAAYTSNMSDGEPRSEYDFSGGQRGKYADRYAHGTMTSTVTAAELYESAGSERCELIRGQVHMMTPAGFEHGRIIALLTAALMQHVESHSLGTVVGAETGFLIERNPDTVRAPDVAFVSTGRIAGGFDNEHEQSGYFRGAPDLGIEVLSPNDRMSDVLRKVESWLAAGCALVWVVDPKSQTLSEYRPDGNAAVFDRNQTVSADPVVAGFSLPLSMLFR